MLSNSLDVASVGAEVDAGHAAADQLVNSIEEVDGRLAQADQVDAIGLDVECSICSAR
jgi:hypothetical protein